MDPSDLATFLAPIAPYLLKSGIEAAKAAGGELGKKISADSWEGLKKLGEKIRNKAEAKPAFKEALTDVQNAPTDKDAIAALELQLKKLLKEDAELLVEATQLLANVQMQEVGDITSIAFGNRSVAIGKDASGNIIITGDNNKI